MHLRRPPINQTFVLQEPEENHMPKMWTLSPAHTQTTSESVEVRRAFCAALNAVPARAEGVKRSPC